MKATREQRKEKQLVQRLHVRLLLSVGINDARLEEFSNLLIVGLARLQRMEQQKGCRRSKNENALPRRLLSEFSGRSTLVVRWIAPASGSGRYYERSREKKRVRAEKNEDGRLLSSLSAGIPKQRAAMLLHWWTICKSVAGRGHDVATSSSRFRLRS